ncbi:MAG: hypothetical protein ACI8PT_004150, partial [Gammaproteobacteria bacterium]
MSESKSQPSPSDDAPSSKGTSGYAQNERAGSAASGVPCDDRPIEDLGEDAGEDAGEVTSEIRDGPPNSAFTLTEHASASEEHLAARAGGQPDPSPANEALGASGATADLPTLSAGAMDPF